MKFIEEPNQLTIKLEGTEQLWALKRRLQIPHFAIEDVLFSDGHPTLEDFRGGYFRLPGTSVPWYFAAGTYFRQGDREFWYVKFKQPGLLVITLKPDTLNYDKIRLSCRPDIAQEIVEWWVNHK